MLLGPPSGRQGGAKGAPKGHDDHWPFVNWGNVGAPGPAKRYLSKLRYRYYRIERTGGLLNPGSVTPVSRWLGELFPYCSPGLPHRRRCCHLRCVLEARPQPPRGQSWERFFSLECCRVGPRGNNLLLECWSGSFLVGAICGSLGASWEPLGSSWESLGSCLGTSGAF